ncbi:hypothetical protein ACIBG7_27200 [Nonomuraea sp. NPDC050328]|uniref:hypothetical protein n=1 Tax=Nonomuraea sp. NPDC050328 TaxID=3364361 RepID=UPI00378AAA20
MTQHSTPDGRALDAASTAIPDKPAPGRERRPQVEFFQMLAWRWNVTAAKKFARGREAEGRITPREWSGMLHLVAIDTEHAAKVDMSEPLIVITVPGSGMLIIDGWHRLYKALDTGVPELAAVVLTTEEERACRIFGGEPHDEDDGCEDSEEEYGAS